MDVPISTCCSQDLDYFGAIPVISTVQSCFVFIILEVKTRTCISDRSQLTNNVSDTFETILKYNSIYPLVTSARSKKEE